MYFTFKKNNKQTKKPVNLFSQDGQVPVYHVYKYIYIEIKLCQVHGTDFRVSVLWLLYYQIPLQNTIEITSHLCHG